MIDSAVAATNEDILSTHTQSVSIICDLKSLKSALVIRKCFIPSAVYQYSSHFPWATGLPYVPCP